MQTGLLWKNLQHFAKKKCGAYSSNMEPNWVGFPGLDQYEVICLVVYFIYNILCMILYNDVNPIRSQP